jgi:hypothetical protein
VWSNSKENWLSVVFTGRRGLAAVEVSIPAWEWWSSGRDGHDVTGEGLGEQIGVLKRRKNSSCRVGEHF